MNADHTLRHDEPKSFQQTLPAEPMAGWRRYSFAVAWAYVQAHADEPVDTVVQFAELASVNERTAHRWKADGIPESGADNLAVRMGVHPSAIWSEWFDIDERIGSTSRLHDHRRGK